MPTWQDYYKNTKDIPPRKLLVKAVEFVESRDAAIDLGASALNDAHYLLEQGFKKVIAVDKEAVAQEVAAMFPKDNFSYEISAFEDYQFPQGVFNIVNAQYALPFIAPSEFTRVFKSILNSLHERGVITGQLFGDRDEWRTKPTMTFHSRTEAEDLFKGLEILELTEEEKDAPGAVGGVKHWHIFHFIARKL